MSQMNDLSGGGVAPDDGDQVGLSPNNNTTVSEDESTDQNKRRATKSRYSKDEIRRERKTCFWRCEDSAKHSLKRYSEARRVHHESAGDSNSSHGLLSNTDWKLLFWSIRALTHSLWDLENACYFQDYKPTLALVTEYISGMGSPGEQCAGFLLSYNTLAPLRPKPVFGSSYNDWPRTLKVLQENLARSVWRHLVDMSKDAKVALPAHFFIRSEYDNGTKREKTEPVFQYPATDKRYNLPEVIKMIDGKPIPIAFEWPLNTPDDQ